MGISASSLNLSTSNLFRALPTPLANTAEISMGAFRVPSATILYPSNTAFGTNANAALGGVYVSSAAVLEANMAQANNIITSSNITDSSNALETGSALQGVLSTIAEQTPGSKFQTSQGVFSTSTTPSVIDVGVNSRQTSQIATTSNIRTTSPVIDDRISLTGRNATSGIQNSLNYAAVNANYNVNLTNTASSAIQQLNNAAAQQYINSTAFAQTMSKNMPIVPALPGEISSQSVPDASGGKYFDTLTESFNNIMSGGGHGGTGGNLSEQLARSVDKTRKKGVNFLG